MKEIQAYKTEDYSQICLQLEGLLAGESDPLANLCNAAAALWMLLPDINWVGFYIRRGDELVLGPFQGKPACTRIPLGKGVCGTAAQRGETVLVPDVHAFPGHIACDGDSRSEIVIPLFMGDSLWGVLDIDSPILNRFGPKDRDGLEQVARRIEACLAPIVVDEMARNV